MSGAGGTGTAGPDPGDPAGGRASASKKHEAAPALDESLRQVLAAGRSSLGAAGDASRAFRTLVVADISLARSAFGRTLAFAGMAIVFGASAWLLLMATVMAFLRGTFDLTWPTAMLVCAAFSALFAGIAGWAAARYFEHTRLKATRRQLARLGLGELAEFAPPPDSSRSAREVEETVPRTPGGDPPKDDLGVPITPP